MDNEDPRLYFNGLTSDGHYVTPPVAAGELGRRLSGLEADWNLRPEEDPRGIEDPTRAPRPEVNPDDLEKTGWAVVWAPGLDPRVRRALAPLCDLRKEQAGQLYREILHHPGEDLDAFLGRLQAPPGHADPFRLPYYVLLVGGPEDIPFSFQAALDQVYAVGRIHFDAPEHYATYARSVVDTEDGRRGRREREIAFFAPEHPGDPATQRTCKDLVEPLIEHVREARPAWPIRTVLRENADKAALGHLLGGDRTPSVLFVGCHGLKVTTGPENQRARQGALITADWPGGEGTPVGEAHTLAAADLADDADACGLVAFFFACYGLGTPRRDSFHLAASQVPEIATQPFVAGLAKRLLSLPGGAALAVVGHVDRTWTTAFDWAVRAGQTRRQTDTFNIALETLLDGRPAGWATEYFGQLAGDLSQRLAGSWERRFRGEELDLVRFTSLRLAQKDAQQFTLFGDPAVRLSVGGR